MPFYRLTVIAFWSALLFAFVMATLPHPPHVLGSMWDKEQHGLAFAALTVLALLAYQSTSPLRIGGTLSAFGALIEVVQAIPALHRDSDYHDWIADIVAIVAVLLVRAASVRLWRQRSPAGKR